MDEGWKNNEIKKVETVTGDQKTQDDYSQFSEKDREALSQSFMNILKEEKERLTPLVEKIGGGEYAEKNKSLMIFSSSLQRLIKDPLFPTQEKMIIQIALFDLSPNHAMSIDGTNMYPHSVITILKTLNQILTPEVAIGLNSYAEKIFLDPLK